MRYWKTLARRRPWTRTPSCTRQTRILSGLELCAGSIPSRAWAVRASDEPRALETGAAHDFNSPGSHAARPRGTNPNLPRAGGEMGQTLPNSRVRAANGFALIEGLSPGCPIRAQQLSVVGSEWMFLGPSQELASTEALPWTTDRHSINHHEFLFSGTEPFPLLTPCGREFPA